MNPSDVINPTCIIGGPVICAAKNGVDSAVSSAASNGFKQAAETIFTSYDDIIKQFLTSWVGSDFLVSLDNKATAWFQDTSLPITILLLTVGLMVAGIRTMYTQRGEEFGEAMRNLARVVAVTSFGTVLIQILVWGGDAYAEWILKVSGTSATAGYVDAAFATASPGLALLFGLVGVLAVGIQWVIMFVRQAMLLLLNAFWPMSASYAMLRQGQQAFEKITAWIIAFIIYSPLAASIYAFAWRLKSGQDGAGGVIYGLMLIILAVVALPAIMRLITPVAAALGNASGGAMAMGFTAAAVSAGVAVGAAVATGGAAAGAGAGAAAGGGGAGTAGAAEGGQAATAAGTPGAAGESLPTAGGGDGDAAGGGGADTVSGTVGDAAGGGSADTVSSTVGDASASGAQESGSSSSGDSGGGQTAAGAGESASGSNQSSGSRAAWAAAQHASDNAPSDGSTAEGMIGE
jgi:type IV secretion system protein TrbL